jgi:capsule polysaccharide modification protein KpsS
VWREKRAWLENPTYVEFDEILKKSSSSQPTLFLPLQMSPEATIDYWSTDMKWIDYEDFVCDLVGKFSPNFRIVVKEHPNVVGFRTAGFYKRLAAIPSCSLVHHKVNSNQILKACDGVIVCTGSVGFEAFLRGKPVFTSSEIFYDERNYTHRLNELFESGQLPAALDDSVCTDAVESLLKCVAPGKFINDGTWSALNPEHLEENAKVAKAITLYLEESVMQK